LDRAKAETGQARKRVGAKQQRAARTPGRIRENRREMTMVGFIWGTVVTPLQGLSLFGWANPGLLPGLSPDGLSALSDN
jgi:hypothetical protein